jgi:predicted PhzF superfamily epimerase YddE/YHI9
MHLTVVDAFTDAPFTGNPASVAFVDEFPSAERMQAVAQEMNHSETAFVVARTADEHDLRWFTPSTEVNLCGHATLAAAFLLGRHTVFHTRSGVLVCDVKEGLVAMDFPVWEPCPQALPTWSTSMPTPVWTGTAGDDWLVEFQDEEAVRNLTPDLAAIAALGRRGLIVTAKANSAAYDVVSRVFGPNVGIAEDPVTGSAHCALAAYWQDRLGRDELVGYQASRRGGTVRMQRRGDRVRIAGTAVVVAKVEFLR